ncbi:MAG: 50S ribosomal protein L1 [Candidatus Margulisbacteria bacterium]|nr:50S ribosomal protein L1 [Candidatus Margulisiibacteriota bacterium]
MARYGKKYQEKEKLVEKNKFYRPTEALQLVKRTARTKFDESVDLAMKLGVDPKKHSVRGTVLLPAGSGKSKKVAVIAKADKIKEAEEAGADLCGGDDLVGKIQNGFLDFDILIVTPDMMGAVGKLGKVLGPKGLMPNPKTGTVTMEIEKTVKEFKGGKVEFKMDKNSALHMLLGKVSFEAEALEKNFSAALEAILHVKPTGLKGSFVQSITVSSTMGPGVKIDPKIVLEQEKQ